MKSQPAHLDFLFSPRSVAVVGAAREKGKVGRIILENIVNHGFRGEIYPVNPKAARIKGRRAYPSVADVPGPVDLAVIVIPAPRVLGAIEECAREGVRAAVVISAGFKEAGLEGAALEARIKAAAAAGGMRLLGPNCLGLISTAARLNASFARGMPRPGAMAFFSQSGALCQAILDWALGEGVGFSKFVSIGNKADLDEVSMLEALAADPHTRVILGYIEGVSDGARFIAAAARVTPVKPVIIAKSGTTQAGARAAASHTGSLTGSENAFQAACEASGIIRARTVGELFNFALAFAAQPCPAGPRLAVVTNAGGPGIMAADAIENSGVRLASLSAGTTSLLHDRLPPAAGVYNPVDLMGDAQADRYRLALDAVLDDPMVDGALVLLTPQVTTQVERTAREVVRSFRGHAKPVLGGFMGGVSIVAGERILLGGKVPNYRYPEHGVGAFEAMCRWSDARRKAKAPPAAVEADRGLAGELIGRFRREGKLHLAEADARALLEAYRFPLIRSLPAGNADEAAAAAGILGYPVALKIQAEEILHKSDIGGVVLDIPDEEGVRRAFFGIMAKAHKYFPQAVPAGVLVQPMARGGQEVIIGAVRDPVFGPVIMFGLGGIYVEALKDVSYRLAPLSPDEARRMIGEIRAFIVLSGWRGRAPADLEAVADGLVRLSALMGDFPDILEAEINPFIVFAAGEGARAIDARIIIKED